MISSINYLFNLNSELKIIQVNYYGVNYYQYMIIKFTKKLNNQNRLKQIIVHVLNYEQTSVCVITNVFYRFDVRNKII